MKKVGYLLLLTPTLFLASCQTTPKIDTITESEAIEIINNFKDTTFTPSDTSKVKWNISKGDETAKNDIKTYIGDGYDFSDGKKETYIKDSTRLNSYVTELQEESVEYFNQTGHDAFIKMNSNLYKKMKDSIPDHDSNATGDYFFKYKKNGGGLTIIEESAIAKTLHTRTHYYNESGREDRFELSVNKDDGNLVYTMTIEFHYN